MRWRLALLACGALALPAGSFEMASPPGEPLRVRACERKVIRGGSGHFGADSARCALRYSHRPVDREPSLGFRVVREPADL